MKDSKTNITSNVETKPTCYLLNFILPGRQIICITQKGHNIKLA